MHGRKTERHEVPRELPCNFTSPAEVQPEHMDFLASFMNLAGPDLIVILLIILVLFGAKKLPELAKGMGQAVKEFQKAKDEFSEELHSAGKTDVAKTDVHPAPATVPRIENAPTGSELPPEQRARSGEPVEPRDLV